ncbi:acyl- transferase carnitine dehydratase : Predicted acyl-CoA transferase/carnitine dehydratase OS=Magnetospirillum magneticum (strain AMB-1 / ATCC 700264) GN=amb0816 PE=4 SV=1: CoA_transf_3 [Gemmata massiliana]|uniref:CoA transferase n=1 Tax=Gemmata massiliana TaxID=1210884 RepID=A0A6P2DJF5_9BACT|nr:CaiB/BaiF CoA-transferase family protein [Gemmata massiliana]VTS02882.1 acyl- transferase carnitine dehydratase : Predicted acyl-CoA transferase/carnitine dehydratase OS=Magnetospirillum magneticum (strain AMB-1 / ATCC 700264) GN=amb0816 PE=4 SV=1: CoA_transf_3 [Gemmata massiliana]
MLPFAPDTVPPLHGARVLDAARVLAGPFCGQLLADLGADVIKLERPGAGDDTRGWGPPYVPGFNDLSAYFLSCNRGKRSLTLDISNPTGSDIFHRLLAKSDVLIENFRTDSAEKLGLTPDALLARHPKLIACSISGFGRTGPMKDAPGYDFAIQALSGLMNITGPVEGPPYKVGVALADILTGLYASNAILAALHARARTSHGYVIDIALADCAIAAQVNVAQAFLTSGKLPQRQGNAHLQIVPYQLFATADGWLVLNVGNDGQWRAFCAAAGEAELGADPRFATNRQRVELRAEVVPKVEAIMTRLPTAEWETRLSEANVPHAVVRTYADVFADEQTLARGMKLTVRDPAGNPVDLIGSPVQLHGAPNAPPTMPPRLGEQTERVLGELLGLDSEQVKALKERGIV